MTRYDILMGQNFTDLSFVGINGEVISQMKCDVSLAGTKLDTLLSEHDGNSYMLYDVQDLIPVGDAIAMPVFRNGHAVYNNFVQQLDLRYYNSNKSQTVSRKIIPAASVLGYSWTENFGRFLTVQPVVQKTNYQANEWLWFLMNYNENVDDVVLKISLKSAGNQTFVKSVVVDGYMKDKLLCVDVSPEFVAALFVAEIDKKYIANYTVWLENGSTRISEKREYHLTKGSAYDVQLLVLNSFGLWDTVSVTAGQKNSKEFDVQVSENRRKVKLESAGWIDRYSFTITDLEQGWLKYLLEVIVSRKVYLRDGGELKPIVCTTKNYDDFYNTKIQDEATLEFRGENFNRSVKV
ncbi:hypothetical protein [Emticicia sp. W12TSBA100-4]|uniref:hypothetical protein n=1 Tax=Emticicia sp. W12TSBA100-4 TaxID=3160965 RepID=UPI00330570B4